MSNLFGHDMGWRLGIAAGGLIILLVGVGLIFGGQKYAAGKAAAMADLQNQVVHAEPAKVAADNDGKLVYLTGVLATKVPLTDADTGVTSQGRSLQRKVEMYQWIPGKTHTTKDKKTKKEKTKTDPPTKAWKSELIGPEKLKGESNPDKFPLEAAEWETESVQLGEFSVPADLFTKVGKSEIVKPTPDGQAGLSKLAGQEVSIAGDKYFMGKGSADKPTVGDVQVWYEEVPLGEVSLLASQKGSDLVAFKTSDGSDFSKITAGTMAAEDMLGKEAAGAGDLAKVINTGAIVVIILGLLVFAYGAKNARNQYILNKAMSGFKKG